MKIIAIEHEMPGVTADQFQRLAKDEARAVWRLYQSGIIRELYFRQDRSETVLILECSDSAVAEEALADLPMVSSGLIRFELIPLLPYPGFQRLFQREFLD